MNPATLTPPSVDVRNLRLGAPGSDDSKRSPDEIRIIKEMASEDVEMFLQANNIDTAAARELRNEPLHVAYAVLERGPLRACINPSGALVARIRDAKRGVLTGGPSRYGGVPPPQNLDPNASELDKFLMENRIDQAGIASLRSEPIDVQKAVMAKGPLVHSTNPSASLMARIRNCRMDQQQQNLATMNAGMAAVPGLPPAPKPLSLEDNRPSPGLTIDSSINDEALKAIQKLSAAQAAQTPPPAPLPAAPPVPRDIPMVPENAGPQLKNREDQRLQDEALKAIHALNYADT